MRLYLSSYRIGDQTLWTLGTSTNGVFTGTSSAQLAIGPLLTTSNSTIQGNVTPSGQITMVFTPVGGGATTIGLGQMQTRAGGTQMEMQSHSASRDMLVVASSRPLVVNEERTSLDTSMMWLSPALMRSTTVSETSNPSTVYPARAISTARGSPT